MLQGMVLLIPLLLLLPATAFGQRSRCADCHFANLDAPSYHLDEWDRSPHGRSDVGCEKCHGGDATTFELLQAHRGLLRSSNPASPANRRNLPQTCGACHTGQFVEFQKSRHFELLKEGESEGPTCSTCHTSMGVYLPSPKRLAADCNRCHGQGKTAPRPGYAENGQALLEQIRDVRHLLNQAEPLIGRVKNQAERAALEEQYRQAEVPLVEAVHAGHSFVFDRLQERLGVARQRSETLLEKIANPSMR